MAKLNKTNQTGMVSILVVTIIMIILSLIVTGFAKIIRREQRQTLDRQLNSQAFYAAESGVSDAINAIKNGYNRDKIDCGPDSSGSLSGSSSVLDANANIGYTCLLIDRSPDSLVYDNISTTEATTIPVLAQSGTISTITLSWQDTDGGTNLNCSFISGQFPPNANWPPDCDAGVFRIDLVPGNNFSRAALISGQQTAILQPINGGPGLLPLPSQGKVVSANCNASNSPRLCKVTISGLDQSAYYLRARSIYKDNSLTITATDSSNNQLSLRDAQALVDSTGKAQDVLNRIVVRVSLADQQGSNVPAFAIQSSETICKRLAVAPGVASTDMPDIESCQIN